MFQVTINAAIPERRSPTKFVNIAVLVLATAVERKTAEWICENASESADYIKMVGVLKMLYPDAAIACGVRPAMSDIVPQG